MNTPRRPSMADRTMSTPISVDTLSTTPRSGRMGSKFAFGLNILTPPASPRHARSSSDLSNKSEDSVPGDSIYRHAHEQPKLSTSTAGCQTSDRVLICPYEVETLKDQRDRNQVFGYGAWSTVFRGTCHRKPTSGLITPPLSPVSGAPVLVAVKQPARKDAKPIIESEGQILTFLMEQTENERYIVPFFGILQSTSSLILAAIPLSLEEHIRKCAVTAQAKRTTWNMSEPVVGSVPIWLNLALKMISALHWLHQRARVIHGDIKPGNILLARRNSTDDMDLSEEGTSFNYEPVFADFSSSQRLDTEITPNTLSAVTREYTAPELLSSKVLRNPNSSATKTSDVFSLAVTLLVAATGNTMVYSGSVFQRQAMATQGWMVIQSVRNGPMEEGARAPRRGTVEKVLEKAVLRDEASRINVIEWKTKIEDVIQTETSKL